MANWFCYMELTTSDLDGAQEFYTKLFDWKVGDMPGSPMPYRMVDAGKEPMGGMMGRPRPETPLAWTIYVEVEDLDEHLAKVVELGGKVLMGKQEVPEYGWFAVIEDPQGAALGLWQNKPGL